MSNQSDSSCESTVNLNLKRKGINIVFLNTQGLCGKEMCKFSKVKSMLTSVENKNYETNLKQHKDGFHQPFSRDNLKSGGGGIIVYVRNDIIAKQRTNLEINDIDCLWIEISPRIGNTFLVGSFYRNPNENSEGLNRFEVLIENVLLENNEIIILGDFNKDLLNLNINNVRSNFITSFGQSVYYRTYTRYKYYKDTHRSCICK